MNDRTGSTRQADEDSYVVERVHEAVEPVVEFVGFGNDTRGDTGPNALFHTHYVDNRLIVPFGIPIRLIVTSADVIHSWALQSLGIKIDAVPGRINQVNLYSNRPGLFFETFTNGLNSNLPGHKPRVAEKSVYGPRGPGHMSQVPDLEEDPRSCEMRYSGQYASTIIRRGPGKSAPRAQRTSGGLKTKFLIGYNE
ncbi:Cytochrome c oxidase subunit 2 [Habropoda laboriosa]|uniref:cytochrome-c oxidase n=1 Tax=Habropoda laboriosa TaxID=597456 RepID=A0A0L7RFA0_9HYME|nr:Cytochrome c oxidase subunit 2 [Habropoda laboriosa]